MTVERPLGLALGVWMFVVSVSTTPALTNDTCAGAIAIPGNGPFPYLTAVIPDITEATNASGHLPPCVSSCSNGVWFRFSPITLNTYRFTLSMAETLTTVPDTVMALFSSTGPCTGLVPIACNDDDACLGTSELVTSLTAGQTYYVGVWRFGNLAAESGETAIQLGVSVPSMSTIPPINGSCSSAQVIPSSGPFPFLTAPMDVAVAASTNFPAPCETNDYSWSIWYRFRPPTNGIYNFSTCYDTATTVCDTIMSVYGSSGDCSGMSSSPIACSDDAFQYRAAITLPLSSAANYYIVVWGKLSDPLTPGHTSVQLRVSPLHPKILSANKVAGGPFQMQFSGLVRSNYNIEASTNLKSWAVVGQTTGNSKGTNLFLDLDASSVSNRLYRLNLP